MLNPSDINIEKCVIDADLAQFLRGCSAFGAVAFHEGEVLQPEQVQIDAGYADCLPILGGGCWRDPASPATTETMR